MYCNKFISIRSNILSKTIFRSLYFILALLPFPHKKNKKFGYIKIMF